MFRRGKLSSDDSAITTSASSSVICEGSQALKSRSGNSCGHSIVQGSSDVFVRRIKMANTSKQKPLGCVNGSLLQNTGLCINKTAANYVGTSHDVNSYASGSIVNDTCLRWLTYAINSGYNGIGTNNARRYYGQLISIGANVRPH